ncbi:MAG: cytochrome c-type biogenesis protein CcmH [Pseudomonadota bacterium]
MKKNLIIMALVCFFLLFLGSAFAKVELHEFENKEQQKLYKKLSEQLRCLVCQNQNLADSNAELAQDMRSKTYQLVIDKKSESEIIDYWVTRYGDFVLYNPPFKGSTFLLWVGPFLLLLLALYFGKRIIQNNNRSKIPSEQSVKDHEAVRKLLSDNKK